MHIGAGMIKLQQVTQWDVFWDIVYKSWYSLFTSLSYLSSASHSFSTFSSPLFPPLSFLFLQFFYICFLFSFSVANRPFKFSNPARFGGMLYAPSAGSGASEPGRQRIFEALWAQETHLLATWQQFWVTFFSKRSNNFKCSYSQTSGN